MIYNTQRKKLPMPEYGRGIQEMVDYALTLEDREERQCCAQTIVTIMGNMFPHLRDVPDFKHKLWDHLAEDAEVTEAMNRILKELEGMGIELRK